MPPILAQAVWPATSLRRLACLALLSVTAGCAGLDDPFEREGTWKPEGLANANLAAMIAHPHDMVEGVNDDNSSGALAAAAVHRLLTDHVKPLAQGSVGPIQSITAPPSSSGGGQ